MELFSELGDVTVCADCPERLPQGDRGHACEQGTHSELGGRGDKWDSRRWRDTKESPDCVTARRSFTDSEFA